ncbi:hypothetical protein [Streptomyces naphthomycinicus]|uniref:hypothetical protein n=1 Tax=Streptomyces naphthomycinicus TaxID=2872625 RepID=UPI001CECE071|nr:hypothetical protein [Streptomyces sp. TML10]
MLNPIDTAAVIRDGGAVGQYPGQIHPGVGWWLGACLVVAERASRLAVAHDGHEVSSVFAERLGQGAINAEHYACCVSHLGAQPETELLDVARSIGGPAAWLSTHTATGTIVRIRLYTSAGVLLDDSSGLAAIRDRIAQDRVPIPVNHQAKGTIVPWRPDNEGDRP